MGRHGRYRSPPWWPEGEAWPPRPGAGDEWHSFGRKIKWLMAFPAVLFGAVVITSIIMNITLIERVGLTILLLLIAVLLSASFRPVGRLTSAAARLAQGDYSTRVSTAGRGLTLGRVAHSFNELAARLESAEEQRRRLMADIGHELRTPLTVIRGELEAIVDGVHPADPDHLERLLEDVDVIERLLDDLRTLSMAESGTLELHREPADLGEILADSAASLRRLAGERNIDLSTSVEAAPAQIDPVRIREVVTNLLVNAVNATPAGGAVHARLTPGPDGHVIEIEDSGAGIPPDQLERVFDRFQKGSGSTGSGLGLTISRDLVRAHGGTIRLHSVVGEGTTVTVTIPTAD